jgi:hypothetical protein
VLVAAHQRLRDGEPAGSPRLACTNPPVVTLFALTGPLRPFPLYASVEQARAAGDQPADPSGNDGGGRRAGGNGRSGPTAGAAS